MQVENKQKTSSVSGMSGDGTFSAKMDGIAFQTMISTLYKDKPRAVVRETWANCRDAHNWRDFREDLYGGVITKEKLENGTLSESEIERYNQLKALGYADPGKPVEIHLPTEIEPWLEFADYGVGLTLEESLGEVDTELSERVGHPVRTGGFLNTMFNSGKRDENMSIGGFGLGCKSPLSITDSFTYRVIKNHEEHQFIVFYGKGGCPDVTWLTRTEDYEPKPIKTDRENGVIVRIEAIDSSLFNKLRNATADILQTFPEEEQPIINEGMYEYAPLVKKKVTDNVYIVEKYSYGSMFQGGILVETGGVVYPLDSYKVSEIYESKLIRFLKAGAEGKAIVVKMPLGSVGIPPSREEISYDDVTVENIKEQLDKAKEVFEQDCMELLKGTNFLDPYSVKRTQTHLLDFYDTGEVNKMLRDQYNKVRYSKANKDFLMDIRYNTNNGNIQPTLYYIGKDIQHLKDHDIAVYDRFALDGYTSRVQFTESIRNYSNFFSKNLYGLRDLGDKNIVDVNGLPNKSVILINDINEGDCVSNVDAFQRTAASVRSKNYTEINEIEKKIGDKASSLIELLRYEKECVLYVLDTPSNRARTHFARLRGELHRKCGYDHDLVGPPVLETFKKLKEVERIEKMTEIDYDETSNIISKCFEFTTTNASYRKKPVVVKVSELKQLTETTKKVLKKYRRSPVKTNEFERNVFGIKIDSAGDFTTFTTDYTSSNYSGMDTSTELTRFFNGYRDEDEEGEIVFWISEEDFNEGRKQLGVEGLTQKQLKAFSNLHCNGNAIFMVKGVRTASRKLFDEHDRTTQIKLEDIVEDMKELERASFLDGTHESFKERELNYEGLMKFDIKEFRSYLMAAPFFTDNVNPRVVRDSLRRLKLKAKENPVFAEYLSMHGYDLDRLFDYVTQWLRNDIWLAELFPTYQNYRSNQWTYESFSGKNRRLYRNFTSNKPRVTHFSTYNLLDYDDFTDLFPEWFLKGSEPYESDVRNLTELINLFYSNEDGEVRYLSKFKGYHFKITQEQLDTMLDCEDIDTAAIAEQALRKIKKSFKKNKVEFNESHRATLINAIENTILENIKSSLRVTTNPHFTTKLETPRKELIGGTRYLPDIAGFGLLKRLLKKYEDPNKD